MPGRVLYTFTSYWIWSGRSPGELVAAGVRGPSPAGPPWAAEYLPESVPPGA